MNEKRSPTLVRVQRLDSIPLDGAQFTEEGYLIDRPIVTTTGIFEYVLPDGSVRRELRLPEDVFDRESLASYKGKPVILTHAGGKIDKTNVQAENIGTVLSEGYQDGEDVRAEIIIHNMDAVDRSGLKELSLGYECDWEEEPGEWNGQPYDAIQHNIRINHLAVVHKARAGKKARLNLDGKDKEILKGEKQKMANKKVTRKSRRNDGIGITQDPEALFKKFLAFLESNGGASAADEGDPVDPAEAEKTDEEIIEQVRSHQDEGEPDDPVSALARSQEDVNALLGIIDKMKAEQDMGPAADEGDVDEPKEDENDPEGDNTDEDDPENPEGNTSEGEAGQEKELTADSIDAVVRARVEVARIGDRLHLDGLDCVSLTEAKKRIILAENPGMRLDGKSDAYINAAYDVAKSRIMRPKDINYQRMQMRGEAPSGVQRQDSADGNSRSAASSRQKLLERREGGTK